MEKTQRVHANVNCSRHQRETVKRPKRKCRVGVRVRGLYDSCWSDVRIFPREIHGGCSRSIRFSTVIPCNALCGSVTFPPQILCDDKNERWNSERTVCDGTRREPITMIPKIYFDNAHTRVYTYFDHNEFTMKIAAECITL